jgi:GTP-binding protein EngB required for normal cell division
MPIFNEAQTRAILCGFLDIHRRMAELEALLTPGATPTPFSEYVNDLSPTEAKVIKDYFARIRTAMLEHLRESEIPLDVRKTSLRWAIDIGIAFVDINVAELGPKKLRGYGALKEAACAQDTKFQQDLKRLVDQAAAYVRQGLGRDLSQRLSRLETARVGVKTLSQLENTVTRWQLVEFRPAIEMIVSRLESPSYEIAVFGRVSSGKSSLLNHIVGVDALPVGVTPVTAVPTRIIAGDKPVAVVSFAEFEQRVVRLEHVWEYASEEGNPGNHKHVTGIVVTLPSSRLRDGVILVDTPGVGSLALSGGAEALAYLPRCDLGVVLVDSASTLNHDDLALLRALYGAGIPVMLLLSKADLLAPSDRKRMAGYIREEIRRELELDLLVHPVSIVGADESLLTRWFEEDLAPLLEQHRALIEASLRRKIAYLRESVIATLETILDRRRGGRTEGGHSVDTAAAIRLLDEADEAIRHARDRSLNWSDDSLFFAESIPSLVADAILSAPPAAPATDLARMVEETLCRRGIAAQEVVARLQDVLATTIESLRRVSLLADADVTAVRDFHAGGLPTPNLGMLRDKSFVKKPSWARIIPPLAALSTERWVRRGFGSEIHEAVRFHDRQVQSWLRTNVARMVELYEGQASAFREQLRRLTSESPEPSIDDGQGSLEADLRRLRQSEYETDGHGLSAVATDEQRSVRSTSGSE